MKNMMKMMMNKKELAKKDPKKRKYTHFNKISCLYIQGLL